MKASIGIQEVRQGELVEAARLDVSLEFSAEFAAEDLPTRQRIELRGVEAMEEWLLNLRAAHQGGKYGEQ